MEKKSSGKQFYQLKFQMQKNKLNILFSLLCLAILVSCSQTSNNNADEGRLKVLSSFSIISDIAQEIGQDKVLIHNLVPIGMAPHEYEPRPNDVKFATHADLILYNGLNLEGGDSGWLIKLTYSVGADRSKVVEVSKNIDPMYLRDEKGLQEINPHAFISPKLGIEMAKAIQKALIDADTENRDFYEKNANVYIGKLEEVDKAYRSKIAEIPKESRILMTSEMAFQYMTKEYGLKEGYIWAIDTDDTGTPSQIKSAIEFIQKYNPPVLFVESNVDKRPMQTVSRATGVPIYKDPIFSDELGKTGKDADTYIKFLEYNLDKIYNGLIQ